MPAHTRAPEAPGTQRAATYHPAGMGGKRIRSPLPASVGSKLTRRVAQVPEITGRVGRSGRLLMLWGEPIDAATPCSSRGRKFPTRGTLRKTWLKKQRSEEHTSELQSRENLVCRLLLEKQK